MSQTKAQLIDNLVQALNFTATASAPANGAFLSATNTLALATNSAQRLTIDSSGNVGIDTTSPITKFDVNGDIRATTHMYVGDSIFHVGDTNTKIRFPADDTFTVETAGSERMRIDSSGRLLVGSSSAPAGNRSQFSIISATANSSSATGHGVFNIQAGQGSSSGNEVGQLCFSDPQGDYAWIQAFADAVTGPTDKPGRLTFSTTADGASIPTERMRIDSSGKVGIGTTSPDELLHISAASNPLIRIENTDTTLVGDQIIGGIEFEKQDSSGAGVGVAGSLKCRSGTSTGSSAYLAFSTSDTSTNNQERMRITSDGRVFIGQTNPAASANADDLCIGNNDGSGETGITLGSNTASSIRWADGASNSAAVIEFEHGSTNAFKFMSGGAEHMRINSSGNVGIGTTSPRTELDIHDGQLSFSHRTDYSIRFYNGEGNNWSSINNPRTADGTNGSELEFRTATGRLLLDTSGKMGININNSDNTSPVRDLDIASSTGAILRLISSDDSLGANERLGEIEFFTDDDDGGHIGSFIKAIADPSDSFGRRTALLFGTQSAEAQNAIERVRIPAAGGITFNGDTAAANALDDYEEGTFTPTVATGVSAIGYATQNGRYTKIGDRVDFTLIIRINSATLTSSAIKFGGLPFTSANITEHAGGAFIPQSSGNFGTTNTFRVNHNSTEIQVISAAGDAVAGTSTSFNTTNRMIALTGFYFV